VFQNRRWDSDFLAARALIASGVAGEITHFESHYDRYRPHVRNRWREQPGPGAGLWRDLGPHLVDQALVLFGTPARLFADFARQRPGAKVEDWCHVVLDYGERRVILHAGSHVSGRWPRLVMHGQGGSWMKFGFDVQERQLLAGIPVDDAAFGVDPETATWFDGASGEPVPMDVPRGDYRQFYLRVRDAARGEGPNPVPAEEAVRVIETIQAALDSAASGCAVALAV
jgi:predicted dehydrogenase